MDVPERRTMTRRTIEHYDLCPNCDGPLLTVGYQQGFSEERCQDCGHTYLDTGDEELIPYKDATP